MKDPLTPKQVARAISVSESSVKRWCDKGTIRTQYTGGGHRRILLRDLLSFLKESSNEIVRPEVVGLPPATGHSLPRMDRACSQLTQAFLEGNEEQVRRIVLDLYLAENRISSICDQVISKAFEEIGNLWECGEAHVYQERVSCEVAMRLMRELRSIAARPNDNAPLAIGGAPQGDQYNLATTMVELVLCENDWNAKSLGGNLPFETISAAISDHRPRLFWLSVSHLTDKADFLKGYNQLYERFGSDIAFIVGGRALDESIRQQMSYTAFCDNLRHLESFAQTFLNSNTVPTLPSQA